MITKAFRSTAYASSFIFKSSAYRFAKKRGVWFYRLLLSQQFADVINDIYDMNILEKKLSKNNWQSNHKKKVFTVDDKGNIYDDATGEIFGTMNDSIGNKFDLDTEEETVKWEGEEAIIMPDKSKS